MRDCLLKCYRGAALLKESENVIQIWRDFEGIEKAMSNDKLKVMAPDDCYFIDEIT
jgi:hypothetical protein